MALFAAGSPAKGSAVGAAVFEVRDGDGADNPLNGSGPARGGIDANGSVGARTDAAGTANGPCSRRVDEAGSANGSTADRGGNDANGSLAGGGVADVIPRFVKGSGRVRRGADDDDENGIGAFAAAGGVAGMPRFANGSLLRRRGAPKTATAPLTGAGTDGARGAPNTGGSVDDDTVAVGDGSKPGAGGAAPSATAAGPARKTWLHLLQRIRTAPAASLSSGTLKRVAQRSQVIITR